MSLKCNETLLCNEIMFKIHDVKEKHHFKISHDYNW